MTSDDARLPAEPGEIPGLSGACGMPLERISIRTRSSHVTLSAWRLEVTSDQGSGAIVLAETAPTESHYRGEGVFLGWPQERLAAAYGALLPRSDEPGFETPQLG